MSITSAAARRLGAALLASTLLAGPALAADLQPHPDKAARDAAMGKIKPPEGTGGCLFLAVPVEVRREAITAAVARQSTPKAFRDAVAVAAPQCTTRPYSSSDSPLVSAVFSTLQRAGLALRLAGEFAIGQDRLDQAWATAAPEHKAGFYAAADLMLAPGPVGSPVIPDVAPLATAAGLAPDKIAAAAPYLRVYYLSVATLERVEPILAPQARTPAPR